MRQGYEATLVRKGQENTRRRVARGLQAPSDRHRHRPRACFEL